MRHTVARPGGPASRTRPSSVARRARCSSPGPEAREPSRWSGANRAPEEPQKLATFAAIADIVAAWTPFGFAAAPRSRGLCGSAGRRTPRFPFCAPRCSRTARAACGTSRRSRDIDTTAALLRFLGRGVTVEAPEVRVSAGIRRAARGSVRAREADARERPRPRPARRALRAREGVAAGRLRHRRAPGGPAPEGARGMGATIRLERGYVHAEGPNGGGRLRAAEIASTCPRSPARRT